MNENKSAFPVFDVVCGHHECIDPGMTAKEYAAVHLRVPQSGDPELDAMIRESRRADFAGQALMGIVTVEADGLKLYTDVAVKRAFEFADAMLAEWEKEAK